jgi:AcrR family transcriptional regulator
VLASGAMLGRPSPRPRRGSPDDTRVRLVEAAATVFNQIGYFATDSNKLARAAGYSPGTFYQHFPDKRAMFLAVYERWVEDEIAELGAGRLEALAPAARARTFARAVLAHHQRWGVLRASLRALVLTDDVVRDFVLARRRRQLAGLAALRRQLALPSRTRADDWALLLLLERVADSIAWGEAAALDVPTTGLERTLTRALSDLFGA